MSDVFQQVLAGEGVTFPTGVEVLDRNVGVKQTAAFHGEGDVAQHTAMVVEKANGIVAREGLGEDQANVLRLSALLHDVGKCSTTREIDDKPGVWAAPGHAESGAKDVALLNATEPTLLTLPSDVRWAVHTAVRNHMWSYYPFSVSFGAALRSAHLLNPELLFLLWEADHEGRICEDADGLAEQRELAKLHFGDMGTDRFAPWPYLNELGVNPDELLPVQRQQLMHGLVRGHVQDAGHVHAVLERSARFDERHLVWTFGMQGAGKSTWARARAAELDAELVTTSGVTRKKDRRVAHGHGRQQIADAMSQGRNVVVDATHLKRSSRERFVAAAVNYGYTIEVGVFDLDGPLSLARQQTRSSKESVPGHVILRMVRDARFPTPDEYAEQVVVS